MEVQPWAFTTKALYVGHMDHRYLRWQVIDTPGILDHELEKRNVIEMQAVTALAHLPCAVLFFVDVLSSGYTMEQQKSSMIHKTVVADKQLVIVANKATPPLRIIGGPPADAQACAAHTPTLHQSRRQRHGSWRPGRERCGL